MGLDPNWVWCYVGFMRNLLQYPITHEEIMECLTSMADQIAAEEPMRFGDMRPLLLKAAAEELEEWRACALYDPMMDGPRFKGWDRSQMERCRKKFIRP